MVHSIWWFRFSKEYIIIFFWLSVFLKKINVCGGYSIYFYLFICVCWFLMYSWQLLCLLDHIYTTYYYFIWIFIPFIFFSKWQKYYVKGFLERWSTDPKLVFPPKKTKSATSQQVSNMPLACSANKIAN